MSRLSPCLGVPVSNRTESHEDVRSLHPSEPISDAVYGHDGDLQQRVEQHKSKEIEGFTKRYAIDQLVYYELHSTATEAIAREKKIKGWIRAKKFALIEENNPGWHDLTGDL